jgi:hypothetical protein
MIAPHFLQVAAVLSILASLASGQTAVPADKPGCPYCVTIEAPLMVQGIGGTSAMLSPTDIWKLPQQTVKTTDHGVPVTFQGVLLTDVLAKVDLPTGEKFHHAAASYYLVVGAKDGYRVVFAWAELDSGFMDKPVYLVTMRDGKRLDDKQGPFALVVPGEKRNARWVRQVTLLDMRQAK